MQKYEIDDYKAQLDIINSKAQSVIQSAITVKRHIAFFEELPEEKQNEVLAMAADIFSLYEGLVQFQGDLLINILAKELEVNSNVENKS